MQKTRKTKKGVVISIISYVLAIAIIFSLSMSVSAASNSFKTQNNVYLKLCVDWETDYSTGSDFVSVTAKVYLEHKSLFVGARNNGVVSINGEAKTFSTTAIRQEHEKLSTPLLVTHSSNPV